MNGTGAWLALHPEASAAVAGTMAWRTLRKVEVRDRIKSERERLIRETEMDRTRLVADLTKIATADPNELIEFRRIACPNCWRGEGSAGFEPVKRGKLKPVSVQMDPDPDCDTCGGGGRGYTHVHDTRKVSAAALALYAGVKETQFGIQVLMHSKVDALDKLAKILGAYELDNKQKGDSTAEVARQFFAQLHSAGAGRLPIAPSEGKPQDTAPDSAPLGGQG